MSDNKLAQVEYRLSVWARWYCQIIGGELGYSGLPIDEIIKTGLWVRQTRRKEIATNPMAESIDSALKILRQDRPEIAKALYAFYILPGQMTSRARELGSSRSCFQRRVNTAKTWLTAWLTARDELR